MTVLRIDAVTGIGSLQHEAPVPRSGTRRQHCNDPAHPAQIRPLNHTPQRVFACRALDPRCALCDKFALVPDTRSEQHWHMRNYDWLQYQLSWYEKDPSDALVGETVLLWPSRATLLDEGLILPHQNCIEGTLPVTVEHDRWLSAQVSVPIDLQRYDYFVEVLGCWSSH